MLRKFLNFLSIGIIIFILSSVALAFFKSDKTESPYYKTPASAKFVELTTITQKKPWKDLINTNLLERNKASGSFKADSDNLGIISIPFATNNRSVDDTIIFRLKESGKSNWYYQANYDAKQFQNNVPFPFGFPVITNSKNHYYTFEVESIRGVPGDSVYLDNRFFAKYKYSKVDIQRNPISRVNFLASKLILQLSLLTFVQVQALTLFSLILSFAILQFWYRSRGKKGWYLQFPKDFRITIGKPNKIKNTKEYEDLLLGFLLSFGVLAFFLILTGLFNLPLTGHRKWVPYISIVISTLLLGLIFLRTKLSRNTYILVLSGFIASTVISQNIFNYNGGYLWLTVSGTLMAFCSVLAFRFLKYFGFLFVASSLFLLSINSLITLNLYGTGLLQAGIAVFIVILVFRYSLYYSDPPKTWLSMNKVFAAIFLFLSGILALRSDALSLGSSEFHWGYFTGVMETIRSGGELLWSAPSQYGFLNVLIPSLLPWTVRNSFFIFQAFMFFLTFLLILYFVFTYYKRSMVFVFMGFISLSLFYFADPAIIGPTPYPSSSVIRFFGVYLLIFSMVFEYLRGNILDGKIRLTILLSYVISALWSGESLLYTTPIFFAYLTATSFSIFKTQKRWMTPIKFAIKNFLIILGIFILFNLVYFAIYHHFPDLWMYLMYDFSYATGFGEIPLVPWGIHWSGIIVISAILFLLWRMFKEKKFDKWIMLCVFFTAIWALSSYYVGRAVVNNLTAILPLIFFIFMGLILVFREPKYFIHRLLLISVFLPWILVGIIGGIGNPQFFDKVQTFRFAENIDQRGFTPDKELTNLYRSLHVEKGTRITYYGEPFGSPVIPDQKGNFMDPATGIPVPVTLLEDPIPDERRKIVIQRFIDKTNEPFYFVYNRAELNTRVAEWLEFFDKNYSVKKMKGSVNYAVYYIVK